MIMGLFINKESLDNNMNLIRETLKQKIEVINYLQEQLIEYSNLDSTSQAIEVLKAYAKEDINNCFNQMVEVFNSIINKTYLIQDRYEQLCGNCSLDEDELEENINKLNKVIRIVEDVKYNLDYIDLFDTLPLNQYIIDLNDLKQMYQNKLDGLLEFNQYTNNIFNEEIDKLAIIANNLDRLTDKLENPIEGIDLELTKTNSMFMKINNEEIKELTLEEQEKLIGISKEEFSKLYQDIYGFNKEDIRILWDVKVSCFQKYGKEEGEYQFNYLMGRIFYNGDEIGKANDLILGSYGGIFSSEEEIKNFLINELNIDSSDVNYIYYRIRLQHILCDPNKSIPSLDDDELISWLEKYLISQSYSTEEITVILNDISINKEKSSYINIVIQAQDYWNSTKEQMQGKIDYTHYSITTATILTDKDKNDFFLGQGIDDEAGWYGDVFGIANPGSLNNEDYISDLDSENIIAYKQKYNIDSLEEAKQKYYIDLNSNKLNRATFFKQNRPDAYQHVMESGLETYVYQKTKNKIPPGFLSPEAYENYIKGLKDSYRSEYEKLSIEEKINYMNSPADSFAWSLYNDSNVYLEL